MKIIAICNSNNTGEISHKNALIKEFKAQYNISSTTELDSKSCTIEDYNKACATVGNEKFITLIIGEASLEFAKKLTEQQIIPSNSFTAVSTHQDNILLKDIKANLLILPSVLENNFTLSTYRFDNKYFFEHVPSIIPTKDELKKSYNDWQIEDKPSDKEPYIVVCLPGDAPDGKERKLFDKSSTQSLAIAIRSLQQKTGYNILVTNSPRTGQYDTQGNLVGKHQYNKDENPIVAIDEISKLFISELTKYNVPHKFYNFSKEIDGSSSKVNTVFNQLWYLSFANQNSFYIIPGESTSMLGQIPAYLTPNKSCVFKPSSMNETHNKVFQQSLKNGNLTEITATGAIVEIKEPKQFEAKDAAKIAEAVWLQANNVSKRVSLREF